MNGFLRDMAILAAAIVAGVIWTLYSLVTRRGQRMREREVRMVQERQEAKQAPVPGLAEYASSHGWRGPSTELGGEQKTVAEYVERMLGNLNGYSRSAMSGTNFRVSGPLWANLFSGTTEGRAFLIGNVWMGFGPKDCPGSVCVLHLGEALPPLFVNLRNREPYLRFGMKEMRFESDAFNRRFRVMALNREYAMDMISERAMEVLLERDDWVFYLEFDRLVCLAASTLQSVEDYTARLDALTRFAGLIPHFVEQDRAAQMPTLPDGTVLDPEDPASRERFEQALLMMSPDQRQAWAEQAMVSGARFVAGMLGKDLPPDVEERLRAKAAHLEGGIAGTEGKDER